MNENQEDIYLNQLDVGLNAEILKGVPVLYGIKKASLIKV